MRKSLTALAAAATIGVATLAVPTDANARWRHGGWGAPVAAGVLGGLAAGAIIGSAAAGPYYGGPYYAPAGAYAYGPACTIRRERFFDGWGWRVRHVRVCY
jgi:hypothetical protein